VTTAGRTRFVSVREIAEQLGVCSKTVRRWIGSGELHVHRFGRRLRIADEDLVAFIALRRPISTPLVWLSECRHPG
jgi:excisionase family DNA binding protein